MGTSAALYQFRGKKGNKINISLSTSINQADHECKLSQFPTPSNFGFKKKNVLQVNRSTSKVIIVQSGALKFKCKIKTREAHFFIAF